MCIHLILFYALFLAHILAYQGGLKWHLPAYGGHLLTKDNSYTHKLAQGNLSQLKM